jgi:CHAD domain-containing protein
MAYRFKPTQDFADGFRRVGLQQLDKIHRELTKPQDSELAIHQARKALKRLRSLLRIARPVLGDVCFDEENARYRDMALELSGVRDVHIIGPTLASLATESNGRAKVAFDKAQAWAQRSASNVEAEAMAGSVASVLSRLSDARSAFEDLDVCRAGYEDALKGLEQGYALGRRRLQRAVAQDPAADEAALLHDWRKAVQHHMRHLLLFSVAWTDMFEAHIKVARQLALGLGCVNDLDIVMAALAEPNGPALTARQYQALDACARERQQALRAIALVQGRLLFAEDRAGFGDRMTAYWAAAVESAGKPGNQV